MLVLGIETSCDETSVAIVRDGSVVLSNVIATSRKAFEHSGGVIPEEAARKQLESMMPVVGDALRIAGVTTSDIDLIAVTKGPGLLGSLLVGTTTARILAALWRKPLVGIHHTLGHLSSIWLDTDVAPVFPVLTLSASGGHTELWLRTSHATGMLLGKTRDDAAGEAFDKGAQMLGLPYPGGPSIAKAAKSGRSDAFTFPVPLRQDDVLDFSFSGLKTALRYLIRDLEADAINRTADLAASYQHALCRHLYSRVESAARRHPDISEIHIVGGVSANEHLRSLLSTMMASSFAIRTPSKLSYCTDNGAMIAAAGYFLTTENPGSLRAPFRTGASLSCDEIAVAPGC